MGGPGCKVVLCICGAAQELEKGNEMLAYRQSEGEQIHEHKQVLDLIRNEVTGLYDILNTAPLLSTLEPDLKSRRSLPITMREGYKAFLANDDEFTDEQVDAIIHRGTTMEELGAQWNAKLLKDAGYPPSA